MAEIFAGCEPVVPKSLEYSAVPLDPRSLDSDYLSTSYEKIRKKLQIAVIDMIEGDESVTYEQANALYDLMETSLYSSQRSRIDYNDHARAGLDELMNGEDDERMSRALKGEAAPVELYTLLLDYPQLRSLELAKLSHPLDANATKAMDKDVLRAIYSRGGELVLDEPRYKLKSSWESPTFNVAVVLRKKSISNCKTKHGIVQVVQRRAFLVWPAEGTSEGLRLDRLIGKPKRINDLGERIEGYLSEYDAIPSELKRWLQPLATSYYAKYVPDYHSEAK